MDETLVLAGRARSRIWAAQESAALYRVSHITPVLQYQYLYGSTAIPVPVPVVPVLQYMHQPRRLALPAVIHVLPDFVFTLTSIRIYTGVARRMARIYSCYVITKFSYVLIFILVLVTHLHTTNICICMRYNNVSIRDTGLPRVLTWHFRCIKALFLTIDLRKFT